MQLQKHYINSKCKYYNVFTQSIKYLYLFYVARMKKYLKNKSKPRCHYTIYPMGPLFSQLILKENN